MLSHAEEIFFSGVYAVKPGRLIPKNLQLNNNYLTIGAKHYLLKNIGSIYLVAVGKAASAMALETEKILGDLIYKGLVITKYNHSLPLQYCKTIEAGHPLPDNNSVIASYEILDLLRNISQDNLLILLISGGASTLLTDVPHGLSLENIQQTNALLLACGASIHEINIVRKHLSSLKGGQLLRFTNEADVSALIISDVPGDDLSIIASGLTVPDPSTFPDAWKVVEQFHLQNKLPAPISNYLQDGLKGKIPDTPKASDDLFKRTYHTIIGNNHLALEAAYTKSIQLGYHACILDERLEGEAKEKAKEFVQTALNFDGNLPTCLIMGGETTVTINGDGKGGRNQEFVLSALCELMRKNIPVNKFPVILSGATDGTDGPTEAAGAKIDYTILQKIKTASLNPVDYLENNDAYHFFKQLNALLMTGPTQTNVMDIVIGLIK